MKHTYEVNLSIPKGRRREVKALVSEFGALTVELIGDDAAYTHTDDGTYARMVCDEARRRGIACVVRIQTHFGYEDALKGQLGLLQANSDCTSFAQIPKDGFDFASACQRCGLGAVQVKPAVISGQARRYKRGNFLSDQFGRRSLMRAEIGREIVKATGRPDCMRHLVMRSGEVVKEWMEPVPSATMPPLSRKSEGVWWGKSWAGVGNIGDPPEIIDPCPACGREAWCVSHEEPVRLVYPKAAVKAVRDHPFVEMYEPEELFPTFDPVKRTFKDLYGLPLLLLNRTVIEVLLKHIQMEHIRDAAWIQPVFVE